MSVHVFITDKYLKRYIIILPTRNKIKAFLYTYLEFYDFKHKGIILRL